MGITATGLVPGMEYGRQGGFEQETGRIYQRRTHDAANSAKVGHGPLVLPEIDSFAA